MKGNNTLELNQATMIEAMQEWCEKHLADKVTVESVKVAHRSTTASGYGQDSFEIRLSEKESSDEA